MASMSRGPPGSDIQTVPDLSEERRLAQLRRIEELKTKLGTPVRTIPISKTPMADTTRLGFASPSPALSVSELSSTQSQDSPRIVHYPSTSEKAQSIDTEMSDWIPTNADPNIAGLHAGPSNGDSVSITSPSNNSSSNRAASSSNTSDDSNPTYIKQEVEEADHLGPISEVPKMQLSDSTKLSSLVSSTPPQPVASSEEVQSPAKRRKISKDSKTLFSTLRPRTSIPTDISSEELARQSCEAALSSRLNPFVLHPEEYQLLRRHICHSHVTAYLNVRNRILRLWVRNPLATVTTEEAAGCASSSKWLNLAEVAYEWLTRRGYINFGCVEVPDPSDVKPKKRRKSGRKTIVVIGAGMAGLGCARQLDGLFNHFREAWVHAGENPPRIIVLEGRPRIGGRIYSHPLHNQNARDIPKHLRCTAETGAHIVTGFSHGNPLNMIIRGQLALHYHSISDNDYIFDTDGSRVDLKRDKLVEGLFNDILERTSLYRHTAKSSITVKGNQKMIEDGKDPASDVARTIAEIEDEQQAVLNQPATLSDKGLKQVHDGLDKLTGKANLVTDSENRQPSLQTLKEMGWTLPEGQTRDINLDKSGHESDSPTLGATIDEGIRQYQDMLELTPQDMRLLNWHIANLEYANAANLHKLSLGGWDQDSGNEFQGEHCQVIGGYTQVPRGIMQSPTPLDVRTKKIVTKIKYEAEDEDGIAKIYCENGEVFDADHVIFTAPLGVLKSNSIKFDPPLPEWKQKSIDRLGFGLLNKVILVYEKPFWDVDEDMIGLLRNATHTDSTEQDDYSKNRGRFYLFWNTIKTSGRPVLISMMAGDAAFQAEKMSDGEIIAEISDQLARAYRGKHVPLPSEAIITRWGRDRFARGTYSNVGPEAGSEDYDVMAKRVGNLHFAGEATCGTHPATVHGAYISGLRAASEIIDDFLGPISVPSPLFPISHKTDIKTSSTSSKSIKQEAPAIAAPETPIGETETQKEARLEAFEDNIIQAILSKLGVRPNKPDRQESNPFLLYTKDMWGECKAQCDANRQKTTGNSQAKASRTEIRIALGAMWREAPDDVKKPYVEQTTVNRTINQEGAGSFQDRVKAWDASAMDIRREYVRNNPGILSTEEEEEMWQALGVYAGMDRKAKKASGYADINMKLPI